MGQSLLYHENLKNKNKWNFLFSKNNFLKQKYYKKKYNIDDTKFQVRLTSITLLSV